MTASFAQRATARGQEVVRLGGPAMSRARNENGVEVCYGDAGTYTLQHLVPDVKLGHACRDEDALIDALKPRTEGQVGWFLDAIDDARNKGDLRSLFLFFGVDNHKLAISTYARWMMTSENWQQELLKVEQHIKVLEAQGL